MLLSDAVDIYLGISSIFQEWSAVKPLTIRIELILDFKLFIYKLVYCASVYRKFQGAFETKSFVSHDTSVHFQ